MMHDPWMDRLSDYLDGGLAPDEASPIEAHLAGCQECRAVLAELERVVAVASQLEDREPAADLWPGILGSIREAPAAASHGVLTLKTRTEPAGRRFSFSMPQLLAAALATMMISGTAVWMTMRTQLDAGPTTVAVQPVVPDASLGSESAVLISNVEEEYGQAIRELQREFAARKDQLDPETVRVVEESLRVIDDAIAEARAAVARDPANGYLYRHLDSTMMKKVDLLRRAAGVAVTT